MDEQTPYEPIGVDLPTPSPVEEVPATPQKRVKLPSLHLNFLSKTNFFILFSLLVLALAAYVVYVLVLNAPPTFPQPEEPGQEQPVVTPPSQTTTQPSEKEGWVEYFNKSDEIMIAYPREAVFTEPKQLGQFNIYQVALTGPRQTKEISTDNDVEDGYIVKFLVQNSVTNTDLEQIALNKRNSYIINCPETATLTNITETTLSNFAAVTFSVENCTGNFIETFAVRDRTLVEVVQVYQGDIGYKQKYKNDSNEVVSKFTFTNMVQATPKETWITFTNTDYGIRFRHPTEMNSACCTLNGPISETAEKIIILADNRSVAQGQNQKFTGFGVFVERNKDAIGFREYVEKQKQLLKENYRVVVGKEPSQLTEEEVRIGGQPGVKLSGYAWWGDVYIVQLMNQRSLMIVSKTELNTGEFKDVFADILSSFQLSNPIVQ